jgi:hypothetical protein
MWGWLAGLLGNAGGSSALNFGNMAGVAGALNGGSSSGLNFAQPPENMTGGWKFDPSSIPAMDIAGANKSQRGGGIFTKEFWEDAAEQAAADWREQGRPAANVGTGRVEAPGLGELTNAMSYVTRGGSKQRRPRQMTPGYANEYLTGLLG